MATKEPTASRGTLMEARSKLVSWLSNAAYPLWAVSGIDEATGGFVETLAQDGSAMPHPRRARVHPRQIYAFSHAARFGWPGDVRRIVRCGVDYFQRYYRRPDGLFRTLVAVDGTPLDDRALLYDQAFALLGYSAAAAALDAHQEFERHALHLRGAIESRFRACNGAFRSSDDGIEAFESNPHMHLLEACLVWAEIGHDPGWATWVEHLAGLAREKFINPQSGALGEAFTADWERAPGLAGKIVEPGHQFEWAWLLLRCTRSSGSLQDAAFRLIDIGERAGVRNEVAVNALLDDLSIHDPNARFWPQTERLKAALLAAGITGEENHWHTAAVAAASLFPYLKTPVTGLWHDTMLPTGEFVDSMAPASTFYHLVGAIVVLDAALAPVAPGKLRVDR